MFRDYWAEKVQKNPSLLNDKVEMRIVVKEFKRQMELSYQRGRDDQLLSSKRDGKGREPFGDFMKDLFG